MENANDFIILDPILVVGGYAYGDGGAKDTKDTVELLSLKSGTESRRLGKFPKKIGVALGTTLGEFVINRFLIQDLM